MNPGLSDAFWREAAAWIGIDTVTSRSNRAFIERAARRFQAQGFRTRLQKIVEGKTAFYNLLARRGPSGRPLLLNTHSDTVPPGPAERWTQTANRPFHLTRRAGRAYGLGVADVKLNLLCQWEALRRIGGIPFRRPLALAATYGEERGMAGVRRLLRGWRGPKPAAAIVGEPSEGVPIHRHRGYLAFHWSLPRLPVKKYDGPFTRLRVAGKSAHSSTPRLGVNALERIFRFLQKAGAPDIVDMAGGTAHNQVPAFGEAGLLAKIEGSWPRATALVGEFAGAYRPLPWQEAWRGFRAVQKAFPRPYTVNLGLAETDRRRFSLVFDLRFPPEKRPEALVGQVKRLLGKEGRLTVLLSDPGLHADPRDPAFRPVLAALHGQPRWREKKTCTEAGLYGAWGVPAMVWGPGRSVGNVHRPNESIAEKDLLDAVNFYERLFRAWAS